MASNAKPDEPNLTENHFFGNEKLHNIILWGLFCIKHHNDFCPIFYFEKHQAVLCIFNSWMEFSTSKVLHIKFLGHNYEKT